MARKLSAQETAELHGFEDTIDLLNATVFDSIVPACCEEGCEVEPDGHCEHGHPSILLEMGMI